MGNDFNNGQMEKTYHFRNCIFAICVRYIYSFTKSRSIWDAVAFWVISPQVFCRFNKLASFSESAVILQAGTLSPSSSSGIIHSGFSNLSSSVAYDVNILIRRFKSEKNKSLSSGYRGINRIYLAVFMVSTRSCRLVQYFSLGLLPRLYELYTSL